MPKGQSNRIEHQRSFLRALAVASPEPFTPKILDPRYQPSAKEAELIAQLGDDSDYFVFWKIGDEMVRDGYAQRFIGIDGLTKMYLLTERGADYWRQWQSFEKSERCPYADYDILREELKRDGRADLLFRLSNLYDDFNPEMLTDIPSPYAIAVRDAMTTLYIDDPLDELDFDYAKVKKHAVDLNEIDLENVECIQEYLESNGVEGSFRQVVAYALAYTMYVLKG